mmetsp:Transcript_5435/g.11072  ORF Transcript_5435/g.11072 Transcript_5435/m.11072 type:complete len:223 (-) Transcript_5435:265-933(-)
MSAHFWLRMRKVTLPPAVRSYPSTGAWFSRMTTSCESITRPSDVYRRFPLLPTTAHERNVYREWMSFQFLGSTCGWLSSTWLLPELRSMDSLTLARCTKESVLGPNVWEVLKATRRLTVGITTGSPSRVGTAFTSVEHRLKACSSDSVASSSLLPRASLSCLPALLRRGLAVLVGGAFHGHSSEKEKVSGSRCASRRSISSWDIRGPLTRSACASSARFCAL